MINKIRKTFIKTREFVITDIQNLQRKIEKKRKLSKLLKLLETVKYIDKANSTIKTLLDKTNYKKISELLVILNSLVGFTLMVRFMVILRLPVILTQV